MAKFIILFFVLTGGSVTYLTYTGTAQEKIETLQTENVRSSSYRAGGSSSYNSGGYSYGK